MDEGTEVALVGDEERSFELAQRQAKVYTQSSLVPKAYQGPGSIANVMIAMNMAQRCNADPLMVMQNLHIIQGNPSWSSKFLIGMFNACGRFAAIKYRMNKDKTSCVAWSTENATGEKIEGPEINMKMAKDEGWLDKSGSKWQTMPEQMLRYRAAAFLIRTTAPELGLGLYTTDEVEDMTVTEASE